MKPLCRRQRLLAGILLLAVTSLGCGNAPEEDEKDHSVSTTAENAPDPLIANDEPTDDHEVTAAVDAAPSRNVTAAAPLRVKKPGQWGPGCNAALLAGPFSLQNATDFHVSQADFSRITEIIDEVQGGNGGALENAPRDRVLDSSAFLAHYLRAFGDPHDMFSYDHHFEHILSRLADAGTMLNDDRLDWDLWRAYLLFEQFAAGRRDWDSYRSLSTFGSLCYLYSAKDLLWEYLIRNADRIRADKDRLRWWIDALTTDLQAPGGRPVRRWFLLQLAASTDTKTAALLADQADRIPRDNYSIQPSPVNPFINIDLIEFESGEEIKELPAFLPAIEKIAASQKLSFEIWGIDPVTMSSTEWVVMNLSTGGTSFTATTVLSQENWSESSDTDWFGVSFSRPGGRRAANCGARLPTSDRQDGVFFFTYNARLYVWPKSKMDAAAIQMLHVSGLIDNATYARFRAAGFEPLPITAASDRE